MPQMLFCIGAQKAGTTWLYEYLAAHPQVLVPPVKEVHYFDSLYLNHTKRHADRRRAQLQGLQTSPAKRLRQAAIRLWHLFRTGHFGNAASLRELDLLVQMHDTPQDDHALYRQVLMLRFKGQPVIADITPEYDLLSTEHYAEMANAFPQARFLYLMREPVSRALSNVAMRLRFQAAGRTATTYEELEAEILADVGRHRHFFHRSRYPRVMRALEAAVPKDRILYLFYEDLFTDTSVAKICEFLDIPFKKGDYDRVVFAGKSAHVASAELRSYLHRKLAGVYPQMDEKFGEDLPDAWRRAWSGETELSGD